MALTATVVVLTLTFAILGDLALKRIGRRGFAYRILNDDGDGPSVIVEFSIDWDSLRKVER